jgi:hypothetical protein
MGAGGTGGSCRNVLEVVARQLVVARGPGALLSQNVLRSLLVDGVGARGRECRADLELLVSATQGGVVSIAQSSPDPATFEDFVQGMAQTNSWSLEDARWAVSTWFSALGCPVPQRELIVTPLEPKRTDSEVDEQRSGGAKRALVVVGALVALLILVGGGTAVVLRTTTTTTTQRTRSGSGIGSSSTTSSSTTSSSTSSSSTSSSSTTSSSTTSSSTTSSSTTTTSNPAAQWDGPYTVSVDQTLYCQPTGFLCNGYYDGESWNFITDADQTELTVMAKSDTRTLHESALNSCDTAFKGYSTGQPIACYAGDFTGEGAAVISCGTDPQETRWYVSIINQTGSGTSRQMTAQVRVAQVTTCPGHTDPANAIAAVTLTFAPA